MGVKLAIARSPSGSVPRTCGFRGSVKPRLDHRRSSTSSWRRCHKLAAEYFASILRRPRSPHSHIAVVISTPMHTHFNNFFATLKIPWTIALRFLHSFWIDANDPNWIFFFSNSNQTIRMYQCDVIGSYSVKLRLFQWWKETRVGGSGECNWGWVKITMMHMEGSSYRIIKLEENRSQEGSDARIETDWRLGCNPQTLPPIFLASLPLLSAGLWFKPTLFRRKII